MFQPMVHQFTAKITGWSTMTVRLHLQLLLAHTLQYTMAVSCPTTPTTNATARATRRNRPTPATPDRRLTPMPASCPKLSAAAAGCCCCLCSCKIRVPSLSRRATRCTPFSSAPRGHSTTPPQCRAWSRTSLPRRFGRCCPPVRGAMSQAFSKRQWMLGSQGGVSRHGRAVLGSGGML